MPYRPIVESVPEVSEYVGMDLEHSEYYPGVEPVLKWNGQLIPTETATFNCVMATEVLEHCAEPELVLSEIHRVLKPDGRLFITVPFIWNLHEIPNDEYRYTPYSLRRHLENAGFRDVVIKPLGGWNMALAQMLGLWLGFAPLPRFSRRLMGMLLFPVFYCLIKTDRKFSEFDGGSRSMFPGLSATASR